MLVGQIFVIELKKNGFINGKIKPEPTGRVVLSFDDQTYSPNMTVVFLTSVKLLFNQLYHRNNGKSMFLHAGSDQFQQSSF